MNSSYLIQVNVDFVQLMMIVDALLTFFSDFHLCHDSGRVINVAVIHVYLSMHCPDSNYLDATHDRLRHQSDRLVIKLVVIHVYFPMAGMIHRMPLLAVVISVNADVQGWPVNLVYLFGHTEWLSPFDRMAVLLGWSLAVLHYSLLSLVVVELDIRCLD